MFKIAYNNILLWHIQRKVNGVVHVAMNVWGGCYSAAFVNGVIGLASTDTTHECLFTCVCTFVCILSDLFIHYMHESVFEFNPFYGNACAPGYRIDTKYTFQNWTSSFKEGFVQNLLSRYKP